MTDEDQASPTSTVPADSSRSGNRVERAVHLAAFSLVGLVVLLGSIGLLGVRTGRVSADGPGYTLEVTRAIVSRPGLATPFRVDVFAENGADLPETVTLVVDADYLAIFDFNGLQPTPSATFSQGRSTWWTFDVPPGQSSLRVDMDARLEPAVQWARRGSVTLEVDGDRVVTAEFTTLVMP
jgi:hypothetical protein